MSSPMVLLDGSAALGPPNHEDGTTRVRTAGPTALAACGANDSRYATRPVELGRCWTAEQFTAGTAES